MWLKRVSFQSIFLFLFYFFFCGGSKRGRKKTERGRRDLLRAGTAFASRPPPLHLSPFYVTFFFPVIFFGIFSVFFCSFFQVLKRRTVRLVALPLNWVPVWERNYILPRLGLTGFLFMLVFFFRTGYRVSFVCLFFFSFPLRDLFPITPSTLRHLVTMLSGVNRLSSFLFFLIIFFFFAWPLRSGIDV